MMSTKNRYRPEDLALAEIILENERSVGIN